MQSQNPYSHWLFHTFQSGDRVIVDDRELGTVERVFPDGIHMVKIDHAEKTIALTVHHLKRLEVHDKQRQAPRNLEADPIVGAE